MAETKLRECPFCGAPADGFRWAGNVGCTNRDCGAYAANLSIAAWNRRPPDPAVAASPQAGYDQLGKSHFCLDCRKHWYGNTVPCAEADCPFLLAKHAAKP